MEIFVSCVPSSLVNCDPSVFKDTGGEPCTGSLKANAWTGKSWQQLQLERLESTLSRVYMNVPFYRKKFDEVRFNPDDLRSLDDLRKLPFTTKNDLRDSYPYGLFAVPLREVVRVHASSGTTGMSTVVGYSRNDIKTWSNLVAGS